MNIKSKMIYQQKGNASLVIIVSIGLLMLCGVGYLAYQNAANHETSKTESTKSPAPDPTTIASPITVSTSTATSDASVKNFFNGYLALEKPSFNGGKAPSDAQVGALIDQYVAQPLAAKLKLTVAGYDPILCVASTPISISYSQTTVSGISNTRQVTTSTTSTPGIATVEVRNADSKIISLNCPQ